MSRYLDIAEHVLSVAKQPLNARQILGTALQLNLVPPDLFGQTQHKTLQARISEDILANKLSSRFYRTGRGIFYLRSYLDDDLCDAPSEVFARRRRLGLRFKHILSLRKKVSNKGKSWLNYDPLRGQSNQSFFYQDYSSPVDGTARVWACALIYKDSRYLTYRRGSYREHRDAFLNQRSIGFFGPVVREDKDLFSQSDEGLMKAVVEITAMDLDTPLQDGWVAESRLNFIGCMVASSGDAIQDAVQIIRIAVPSWFEPPRQRLSINDLRWTDVDGINDLADFDPWSQKIIENLAKVRRPLEEGDYGKSSKQAHQ